MLDACLDLLLGSSCAVCGLPGRLLCRDCAACLPRSGHVCWPTPCPAGLALPMAAGEYDGALKVLVNGHKERHQFSLVKPLGLMLAHAAEGLMDPPGKEAGWCFLVPVPSRRRVVRARGHDPMLRVSRHAAVLLRRWGHPVAMAGLLRSVTAPRDQAGLGAEERAANLAGSMAVAQRQAERLVRSRPGARFVVVDDVLTTGSTAREAQRALEVVGLRVRGVATVAATRRRVTASPHQRIG